MSLLDTKIRMEKLKFDIHTRLFPNVEGSTLYFLQRDGVLVNYKLTDATVTGQTTGWKVATNKWQQKKELQFAATDTAFYGIIGKSSHIAIGTTVYSVDRSSLAPPSAEHPYYAIDIEKTGETYTPV